MEEEKINEIIRKMQILEEQIKAKIRSDLLKPYLNGKIDLAKKQDIDKIVEEQMKRRTIKYMGNYEKIDKELFKVEIENNGIITNEYYDWDSKKEEFRENFLEREPNELIRELGEAKGVSLEDIENVEEIDLEQELNDKKPQKQEPNEEKEEITQDEQTNLQPYIKQ